MNHYEERQEARRQRLEERAAKTRDKSDALATESRQMCDMIPMGQPLLVDHYSYKRDLNYRNRMHNKMRKSVEAHKEAERLERRAAAVGTAGISSDDPDAVAKLREKLDGLTKAHETMKAANRLVRKGDTPAVREGLAELGISAAMIDELLTGDFMGRKGFAPYAIQNSNATIRSTRQRIQELEQRAQREDKTVEGRGYTYREDVADNRVKFLFDGKPDDETRALLKAHNFKWSPKREGQPWVRQLTNAGRYAAAAVREALDARDAD